MRKPKETYASITIYSSDESMPTGEHIIVDAGGGTMRICKNVWDDNGNPYGDTDLEFFIGLDKVNTDKARNKFRATSNEELVKAFGDLFVRYRADAYKEIKKWLERKGIEYSESMY